jgi:hypothetical protein
MQKLIPLLVAAIACTVPQLASAVPVRATFNGTVSGSSGFFNNVLNDFPIGTTASFDVTFDDSGLVDDAALVNDFDVAPVSGWVRMGSLEWLLDAGRVYTYTYMIGPGNPVQSYGLQLTGTGPTIAGGAGSLFGLFMQVTPDAAPKPGSAPLIGFRYPFDGGEFYSYADLSGDYRTSRETTSVPEPNTGLLMLSGLALLVFWRAKQPRRQGGLIG